MKIKKKQPSDQVLYSTDHGYLCPHCQQPAHNGSCTTIEEKVGGSGKVKIRRETGGRNGKTVSIVSGLPLTDIELKMLLSELKRLCGSGGTVKNGTIELQGDHCDLLMRELKEKGYKPVQTGK